MAHTTSSPCQLNKWNCQVFINIKKYNTMFKIRKDHLRIVFFLMAYKTSVLSNSQVCKTLKTIIGLYQIHQEIFTRLYANLTVMNPLNLNQFGITQPKLCPKSTFVKARFMFFTIFLDIYENPRRENYTNPSYPKHLN